MSSLVKNIKKHKKRSYRKCIWNIRKTFKRLRLTERKIRNCVSLGLSWKKKSDRAKPDLTCQPHYSESKWSGQTSYHGRTIVVDDEVLKTSGEFRIFNLYT